MFCRFICHGILPKSRILHPEIVEARFRDSFRMELVGSDRFRRRELASGAALLHQVSYGGE